MDTITTRTVGTGFAEIGESVLTETTQTAIVFKPQMHEGGIRGSIIRYKKGRNGDRETPVPVDFRRLNAGDGIEIELNTEAVTNLTQRIQEIQALLDEEGVRPGIHRYRVTNVNDLVITDQNKARIIQRLLEANLGEDIWNQLVQDMLIDKIAEEHRHKSRYSTGEAIGRASKSRGRATTCAANDKTVTNISSDCTSHQEKDTAGSTHGKIPVKGGRIAAAIPPDAEHRYKINRNNNDDRSQHSDFLSFLHHAEAQ